MTPERVKYLINTTYEEKDIRLNIAMLKKKIKQSKLAINFFYKFDMDTRAEFTHDIRNYKILIKALKKQLPAPRHERCDWLTGGFWLDCSCGKGVYPTQPYCMWCGRKLR